MLKLHLPQGVTLFHGDCRDALRSLSDNSVDAVPCDPPYALTSASRNGSPRSNDPETPFGRTKLGERGFMGKTWDTGEVAFDPAFWAEVYRVLKPGGHLAAFSASRTYHRMACAIEDAGFEIRDSLMWIYGTGFPKSQNVAKFIDAALGAQGETFATGAAVKRMIPGADQNKDGWIKDDGREFVPHEYSPASPAAIEFDGFGTALKPAFEPIVLARKPLSEATVAANVLKWRTGALNIDGCRVETSTADQAYIMERVGGFNNTKSIGGNGAYSGGETMDRAAAYDPSKGRWPANVVTDGSDEVVGMFPSTAPAKAAKTTTLLQRQDNNVYGKGLGSITPGNTHSDAGGSAARFFYSAKASKADRNGSKHPTVKPISLMQWLARLITPPGGTILDPFAGSGTTGAAGVAEGFSVILCERESEYVADIRRRLGGSRLSVPLDALRAELALAPQIAALRERLQRA